MVSNVRTFDQEADEMAVICLDTQMDSVPEAIYTAETIEDVDLRRAVIDILDYLVDGDD